MNHRKLLVVFAHPDDETFICGGTLARYAREGVEITLVCATKGGMGRRMGKPPFATRESMPYLRERELTEACEHLGIKHLHFLGIRDKTVEYEDVEHLAGRIVQFIRLVKPDAILTFHERYGGHPDHCAIGRAATLAFHLAGDANHFAEQLAQGITAHRPERLYFITWADTYLHPEKLGLTSDQITVVDISEYRYEKMRAFRAHRSQSEVISWLWEKDNDAVRHFEYNEYFIQGSPMQGYPQDRLL